MGESIPIMPREYIGEQLTKTEYVKTIPRRWTKEEENWCLELEKQGFTHQEIAESVGREHTSVSIKMKRLKKKDGRYNAPHIKEKYKTNDEFIEYLKPNTILDVFCGVNQVYNGKASVVVTNDLDKKINAEYNLDALKLLCLMYYEDEKFDFVDLDPYGSASECFDLAIKIATKGLAITLGEIGHKRFKRLDYVKRHYDIHNLEDFTTDNLIEYIQKQALKNKKQLNVWKKCEWNGISRVWFTVDTIKITEQWD